MKTDMTQHVLEFGSQQIAYRLHSAKRRSLRIVVSPDTTVDVYAPEHASDTEIKVALSKKKAWIARKLAAVAQYQPLPTPTLTEAIYFTTVQAYSAAHGLDSVHGAGHVTFALLNLVHIVLVDLVARANLRDYVIKPQRSHVLFVGDQGSLQLSSWHGQVPRPDHIFDRLMPFWR